MRLHCGRYLNDENFFYVNGISNPPLSFCKSLGGFVVDLHTNTTQYKLNYIQQISKIYSSICKFSSSRNQSESLPM